MNNDIIAAVATGTGGAMSVIRVSGAGAVEAVGAIFSGRHSLLDAPGGRFFYGTIVEPASAASPTQCHSGSFDCAQDKLREESSAGIVIDDVVVSVFRAPHSYTGDDTVEISCHGSRYIQQKILQLLGTQGVRPAAAGEFTMRALLAGRLALSQAEAVADLIAAENRSAHRVASNQMRGGYAAELVALREELVRVAALLELELDFGEEEVEFADRAHLRELVERLRTRLNGLASSFAVGNALKNGVSVAIVGQPNVGKSTLLNALLGDDRAMVSDIAGTTRDTLEECADIGGTLFRFIDTAGVHDSTDRLEQMGIARTHTALSRADVVLLVLECGVESGELRVESGVCGVAPATAKQRHSESFGCAQDKLCEESQSGGVIPRSPQSDVGISNLHGVNEASLSPNTVISNGTSLSSQIAALRESIALRPEQKVCVVVNKIDAAPQHHSEPLGCAQDKLREESQSRMASFRGCEAAVEPASEASLQSDALMISPHPIIPISANIDAPIIPISALRGDGLAELRTWLSSTIDEGAADEVIVSNARHHDALLHAAAALDRVAAGLGASDARLLASSETASARPLATAKSNADTLPLTSAPLPLDLVAQDLREALHYLGLITGAITTPELLQTIFSKFCIGK